MKERTIDPTKDPELVLELLLSIYETMASSEDWKVALDKIIPIVRPYFIFDNLALYLPDGKDGNLEVSYARATGRGKTSEADIAWGETMANDVYAKKKVLVDESTSYDSDNNRLNKPFSLGLPVIKANQVLAVLVIIRFGGPAFNDFHLRIAKLISHQIGMILLTKQLTQQVIDLSAKVKQANLQGDFVSTISHELLTPLGFIKGYTTTLLRPDANWNKQNQIEFLTIIDSETDRLQELLDNLLDSSRLQSGTLNIKFQPVRIDSLLNDILTRTKMHHADFVLDLDITTPIKPIQADPRRLTQVFENLINNVKKYAPGSPVHIKVSSNTDFVTIAFQDEGPGIPETYRSFIFDRFFRVPEHTLNARGTGLGLYICKQIILAHHGDIYIQSEQKKGTTFVITLPC